MRACKVTVYIPRLLVYSSGMIRSFKSRNLKRFWEKKQDHAINAEWRDKIKYILVALNNADAPEDLAGIGGRFEELKEDRKGEYSIRVSPNWRITFGWDGEDAINVRLEDYH